MKFNKLLQKIFKKFFQTLFKFFNGNVVLRKNSNNQNFLIHEINSLEIDKKIFDVKKKNI